MRKILIGVIFTFSIIALQTITATATIITFNDFSDTSLLTINGDAATTSTSDGKVLRLTPALGGQSGSAFSTATINASTFSTYFEFRITNPGGTLFDGNSIDGADGLVFVAQSVSSSIGSAGAGIGYSGINNSIGVEFDTWHNSANSDPSSNHIGIDVNGVVNHGTGSPYTLNVGDDNTHVFDNGNIWYAWVDYNGTTLETRYSTNGVRPIAASLSRDLDIPLILGGGVTDVSNAYVGFTSGTGADWGNHDILSWEYRDEYDPIPGGAVPEPATMLLVGVGLLGLAGVTRRKFKK